MTNPSPELPATRKEAAWLSCRAKTCCSTGFVVPTGRDVWRIARTLDAPLWSFLVYFETPEVRRDAFALDGSERRFRLALAKQTPPRRKATLPCIFLLRTRDGARRCGLGDLRPMVCRSFPTELVAGVLCVRPDAGCSCRNWTLADVDIAAEMALVTARQQDAEEYCTLVALWNARIAAAPSESFDFFAYGDFLLNAYDALAAGLDIGGLS